MKNSGNLIGDEIRKGTIAHEVVSPVTGKPIERVSLATKEQVAEALLYFSGQPLSLSTSEVFEFLKRLKSQIMLQKEQFFERTWKETGFITWDSAEIVDSAIEFLSDFEIYVQTRPMSDEVIRRWRA